MFKYVCIVLMILGIYYYYHYFYRLRVLQSTCNVSKVVFIALNLKKTCFHFEWKIIKLMIECLTGGKMKTGAMLVVTYVIYSLSGAGN